MTDSGPEQMEQLRAQLGEILAGGLSANAVEHAEQIARVAGVLSEAFESVDLEIVVVGGSAIEIHAPGGYVSGDLDLIVERARGARSDPRVKKIFERLGFRKGRARHWIFGDLYVETPGEHVDDPVVFARVGQAVFRIISKEALIAERVAGFKHWKHLEYGQQAIMLLEALREELDWEWLRRRVEKESAVDALQELDALAKRTSEVSATVLQEALGRLHTK